jgi:hypothetical protein
VNDEGDAGWSDEDAGLYEQVEQPVSCKQGCRCGNSCIDCSKTCRKGSGKGCSTMGVGR